MKAQIEQRIKELTGEKILQQAIQGEAERKIAQINLVIAELQKLMDTPPETPEPPGKDT